MPELLPEDIHWCTCRLPGEAMKLLSDPTMQLTLAGGFIRSCIANEEVNDIDLFAPTSDSARASAFKFAADHKAEYRETDNAITVLCKPHPLQFIHRWTFEKPEDVVPSFDFTIARAAIWRDHAEGRWRSICDERFYADLAAKRLTYCSPPRNEDAGGSMLRVLKFYQKGYRIPLDSLGRVIGRLVLGTEPPEDTLSRLAKEAHLGEVLTTLLREVDPGIDPGHQAHLPAAARKDENP